MKISNYNPVGTYRLEQSARAINRALSQLASGRNAEVERSDTYQRLNSKVRGLAQINLNLTQQSSAVQTASNSLQSMSDILQRVRDLTVQSSNSLLDSTQRENINEEIKTLIEEYDRIYNAPLVGLERSVGDFVQDTQLQISESETLQLSGENISSSRLFSESVFNGSFGPSTQDSIVYGAQGGASDFDSDGDVDYVVFDEYSTAQSLLLFKNNGEGVFSGPVTVATRGSSLSSIRMQDIDEDGDQDFIAADTTNLYFYESHGDGSFSQSGTLSLEGLGAPTDYAMGDLNEDGDLDVLAVYSNSLRVFLSDGSGGFNGSTSYGVGTTASSLALMDINGDDKLDVAVANSGSDNTTLYLGSGDGVLSSRSTLSISASFSSHQIVAGDFNGDGHSDLISYGPWFDGMSLARLGAVFLNNGTGSFSQSMTINLLLLGGAERAEVRDYNKDGYDDLAYGGNIYSSAAGQSFTPAITNPFWSYEGFYEDFDGDGIVDVRYFDDDNFLWNTYFGNSKSVNRLGYLQMNSAEDAARFLPILDDSIQKVQDLIAELGVVEERLRLSYDSGTKLQTSLLEASENLVSVDYASVTADLTRQQIMQQAQIAAQVQASLSQRSVLALLDQL